MKIKIISLFFLCSISGILLSQKNNGYFGKKGFVQLETVANYPLFNNILIGSNSPYKKSGAALIRKRDNFNTGFRVNAGYAIKRNVALLVEFGRDYSSVYPSDYTSVHMAYDDFYVEHEMVDVTSTVIIPKIEFATAKALLPMGLSHQIGFGMSFSNVKEKDYTYRYQSYSYGSFNYTQYNDSKVDTDPINYSVLKPIKKYVILYALSMRSPITKSLMINYGIKYTLNLGRPSFQYTSSSKGNEGYTYELMQSISKSRTYSFMNINLGLTYVF